jgi:hypothetical protein
VVTYNTVKFAGLPTDARAILSKWLRNAIHTTRTYDIECSNLSSELLCCIARTVAQARYLSRQIYIVCGIEDGAGTPTEAIPAASKAESLAAPTYASFYALPPCLSLYNFSATL